MAFYQDVEFLDRIEHIAFNSLMSPGQNTEYPGIYRCTRCGKEVTSNKDQPLPPQNHHQHKPSVGPIRWQLICAANTDPEE